MNRKIIHCDADCFFAAIEMRDNPALKSRPVAVGGSPLRRGVISTCNYPARHFGVRSAMASVTALRLCSQLLILPHRMSAYRDASAQMQTIFRQYSDVIEPLSLDEAFLDVSASGQQRGSATRIAEEIRARVRREIGIDISAGVATNKFLAKVASDWNKPDGLCVVTPKDVDAFMLGLPVSRIPGVGRVMERRLQMMGIRVCGELQRYSQVELCRQFGRFGLHLYALCRGQDERPLQSSRQRKSLSVEHTYASDLPDFAACAERLGELHQRLQQRLSDTASLGRVGRVFIKVKFADFTQTTLERSNSGSLGLACYRELLAEALQRYQGAVRLLGVGVGFAEPAAAVQLPLFDA